jgi:carbonic anhydrase/acetyltransferase-like protein (isoleucine patch superfamily)
MIRSYRGGWPQIAPSVYIDPSAQVIGAVTVGECSSIWPHAVARADVDAIRIGAETKYSDHCVLHGEPNLPFTIGNRVTVEYRAVVMEGAQVPPQSLVSGLPGKIIRQTTIDERERVGER